MQTARYRTELVYDPNETYEEYCARRQAALEQGRQAVRERRISGDLYLFYEYLIERVGAHKYTWIGEHTLAEVFGVDQSTIKRWLAKLIRAGLIRRQRQFGTTSRTYITDYDPATTLLDSEAQDPTATGPAETKPETDAAEIEPIGSQEDSGTAEHDRSFRRTDAPTFGADLRRDHTKVPHGTSGGGGWNDRSQNLGSASEIRRLLEQEEVTTFYLAPLLQQKPLDELRAVSRYLDQQHNVRDRARLFAALVSQGFGALLLAGRTKPPAAAGQRGGRPKAQPSHTPDHLKYVSGELGRYIKGYSLHREEAQLPPNPGLQTEAQPHSTTYAQTWQQVLHTVHATLLPSEFDTWVKETTLLLVEDGQAVVGTPNIFAREKLETPYYTQRLTEALQHSLGQPLSIKIVIGG